MVVRQLVLILSLAALDGVAAQAVRMRVVATAPGGAVWRLATGTVERTGSTATAWFFVDHRAERAPAATSSRVRARFDCARRRMTRLERVAQGADGRVVARDGRGADSPAGRGTFAGRLLDAACA